MNSASTSTLEVLKAERDSRKKRAITSSAIVATGTLFGSAFVPIMAASAVTPDECRFSETDVSELMQELASTGDVCREVELFYSEPLEAEETRDPSDWIIPSELFIPFGKDLKIFSNDGVILSSSGSSEKSIIQHGLGQDGYLYENLGNLEIDGLGFYSFVGHFSAVSSNQNLTVRNSLVLGEFLFALFAHNLLVENSTLILGSSNDEYGGVFAGIFSMPGVSEDASRLDPFPTEIMPGSMQLNHNTLLIDGLYSDVFGLGMEVIAEGNIFMNYLDIDPDAPYHVLNIDLGTDPSNLDEYFELFLGPEFAGAFNPNSDDHREDIELGELSAQWFVDSHNVSAQELAGLSEVETDSAITLTADTSSRTQVTMDEIQFDVSGSSQRTPNSLPTFGLLESSFAAQFVSNPLFPLTADALGQTRTLPFSAGAVEVDPSGNRDSGLSFGFSPELFVVSPARMPSKSGKTITLSGSSFPEITEAYVGGKKVKIVSSTVNKLVITAPKGMRGAQEILVKSRIGELVLKDRIFFTTSLAVRGFGDSKSVLSASMKRQIQKFLKENPHATVVTCQGYSSLPLNLEDQAFGSQRGKAVCDYVISIRSDVRVKILSPVVDKRSGPSIRRTVLKVID